MKRIAVFASGNGSNFEAIAKAIEQGRIDAELALLVANRKDAYVLERAKQHQVDTLVLTLKECGSKEKYEEIIVEHLKRKSIDLVCLAGYMLYCGEVLLSHYEGKIINLHPALLPSFKGAHGILDAYRYGVKVYGVTIHYVDRDIDTGKIIDQRAFYDEGYTYEQIEEKIHALEHELYPIVIQKLLKEKQNEKSIN